MGTKKISELTELETLSNNDLVAVVDTANEATKKMTAKKLGAATGIPTNAVIGYDGSTVPGGYEETDGKCLIMGSITTNTIITATSSYYESIIKTSQSIKKGTGISIQNDGGFLIEDGISTIKITANLKMTSGNNTLFGLQIAKNNDRMADVYKVKNSTNYDYYNISNYLMNVEQGDIVYVKAYIDVNGHQMNIQPSTYITVEEV